MCHALQQDSPVYPAYKTHAIAIDVEQFLQMHIGLVIYAADAIYSCPAIGFNELIDIATRLKQDHPNAIEFGQAGDPFVNAKKELPDRLRPH